MFLIVCILIGYDNGTASHFDGIPELDKLTNTISRARLASDEFERHFSRAVCPEPDSTIKIPWLIVITPMRVS